MMGKGVEPVKFLRFHLQTLYSVILGQIFQARVSVKRTWAKFRLDEYFLTKYFVAHTVALCLLSWTVIRVSGFSLELSLSWQHLALLPFAALIGIQVPVLMHNCMHGNLKSPTANIICGELSGFFALMSLGILRINHTLHHAYSDTDRDPHDPSNKSFVLFFFVSQLTGVGIVQDKYFEYHGKDFKHQAIFKLNIALHYAGHLLRLFVWLLVLGPNMFVALYLPAFVIYSLAFAHVNYITHHTDKTGNVEILNKNDNLYYKTVNFIGSGVYFHKNHHLAPRLINPMHLEQKSRA